MLTAQFSPPYILTLDLGTSSARALLFDATGRAVPGVAAQIANEPHFDKLGDLTFDLAHLTANMVAVIDQTLARAGTRTDQIAAVTLCTFVTNIAGIDDAGQPVTPVLTYAQPGSAADAAALRAELGPAADAVHDRTGCVLHSSYLPARLRWVARVQPEWLRQSAWWMSAGEYLIWQFTGVRAASYSLAAWSGLLDRRHLVWDDLWLDRLPIAVDQLSPLSEIVPLSNHLRPLWAARWPALARVPWFPAIGDGAAATVGSGCADGRQVALTIGTTAALRAVVSPDLATLPDGLWLYRITAAQGLLGGATTEGGNLLAWLRATLQLPAPDELERQLAARPPADHGVIVLPFVAGERAPGWNDDARAVLHGFTLNTAPVDLYQAVLEAITYRFALIFAAMAPSLPAGASIVASGGALTASPAWSQIVADVLGRPLQVLEERELACRGLALLALHHLGVIPSQSALAPVVAKTYAADATRRSLHAAAQARQTALYRRLLGPSTVDHS